MDLDYQHDGEDNVGVGSWWLSALSSSSSFTGPEDFEGNVREGSERSLLMMPRVYAAQRQPHYRQRRQQQQQVQTKPENQEPQPSQQHLSLRGRHYHHQSRHRRTEDVEYWRQRAGWFNDDSKMVQYNNGVYDTYYQAEDDGSGNGSGRSSRRHRSHSYIVKTILKVVCVVVALGQPLPIGTVQEPLTVAIADEKRGNRVQSDGRGRRRQERP
jgi:hypothetical protein